ncbi:MAG: DUF3667 domain-containing protein [Acidobacteriota bacterium]
MAPSYRRKTDSLPTCMNCTSVLYGAYCSQCGQQEAQPITFSRLFSETIDRLRRLDFAWPRTFLALSTDPGRMVRRYLTGRRKPYTPPFFYAFSTATVLILVVLSLLESSSVTTLTPWHFQSGSTHTLAVVLAVYGSLLGTLGVAWLQRFLYRGADYGLLETWVFGLYLFGHLALFQIFFALIGAFASTVGLVALGLAVVLVLAFALAGFYRQAVLRAAPAALILGSTYIAGLFVISALVRLALF